VVGGALVAAGWRSIFLVNVPICALTVILLRRHVTESPVNPAQRLDVPGLLLGLVSLAMPAMTAAVVGAAGPEHAGVASGVLNAARQSGGALSVALLGSLFASSGPASSGSAAPTLRIPLAFAAALYLVALVLARLTIRAGPRS
jgi:hypothetical protein